MMVQPHDALCVLAVSPSAAACVSVYNMIVLAAWKWQRVSMRGLLHLVSTSVMGSNAPLMLWVGCPRAEV